MNTYTHTHTHTYIRRASQHKKQPVLNSVITITKHINKNLRYVSCKMFALRTSGEKIYSACTYCYLYCAE